MTTGGPSIGLLAVRTGYGNSGTAAGGAITESAVGVVTTDTTQLGRRITAAWASRPIWIAAQTIIEGNHVVSVTCSRARAGCPKKVFGQPVKVTTRAVDRSIKAQDRGAVCPTGSGMASQTNRTGVGC